MPSSAEALAPDSAATPTLGQFVPADGEAPGFGDAAVLAALERCDAPVWVVGEETPTGRLLGVAFGGTLEGGGAGYADETGYSAHALLPALHPEWLGDRAFCEEHGCRYPYVTGAMATGIASVELTAAGARAGFLSFYGTGGLSLARAEEGLDAIARALADVPGAAWGANLIHSPDEPALEDRLVDSYLARGVRCIEASAFMQLSPAIVRYGATGLHVDEWGRIHRPHRVMAKVSRPEVARHFLQPPPALLLEELVASGALSSEEARLASLLPIADDVTCEADSGGHTDRRPLAVLVPVMRHLRDDLTPRGGWPRPVRIGAAGGLGDPESVAAAFALGADYVVTGSVNQTACESGTSDIARAMLADAGLADVIMAPAADMFELGVEVQVLRRGTLFAPRARKLYELYRAHDSLEEIPSATRERLERDVFRAPLDDIWTECVRFWSVRDPSQVALADGDAHHRMSLVFRWYLGNSNRWAREGVADRRNDYQIWCGPAIGAFNAWTAGTHLADPAQRAVEDIGLNLLAGAVRCTRASQLRAAGVSLPPTAFRAAPRPLRANR
ncbi:MAG: PfaD family polyunsaturated fatty acid/polyketide biosynthesis protein [Gemmatimonadales bacterium]